MKTVTQEYLDGIKEGRAAFERDGGAQYANDYLDNLQRTIKGFAAPSPVGQMLRGERDFWLNQVKRRTQ